MIDLNPDAQRVISEAMTAIAQDPKSWDQKFWDCGTFACLGGHILRLLPEDQPCTMCTAGYHMGNMDEALAHALGLKAHSNAFQEMLATIFLFTTPNGSNATAFDTFADRVTKVTGITFDHQREIYRKHFEDAA